MESWRSPRRLYHLSALHNFAIAPAASRILDMRLLNTTTLELVNFIKDVPQYVILSHTWGDGEVTFDDIDKPYAKDLAGYRKIVHCCQQAVIDGFDWAWIDTCCIDKRSRLAHDSNEACSWFKTEEFASEIVD